MEILLCDPACLYYSNESSFGTMFPSFSLSLSSDEVAVYESYSDHQALVRSRARARHFEVTKAGQRNENERWKATTPCAPHGDISPAPGVCGPRNGNRGARLRFSPLRSKTVTFSSGPAVGGPPAADSLIRRRRFTFRQIGGVTARVLFRRAVSLAEIPRSAARR